MSWVSPQLSPSSLPLSSPPSHSPYPPPSLLHLLPPFPGISLTKSELQMNIRPLLRLVCQRFFGEFNCKGERGRGEEGREGRRGGDTRRKTQAETRDPLPLPLPLLPPSPSPSLPRCGGYVCPAHPLPPHCCQGEGGVHLRRSP